jgi:hypothetical protein
MSPGGGRRHAASWTPTACFLAKYFRGEVFSEKYLPRYFFTFQQVFFSNTNFEL